jgi:hypothetical protein
MTLKWKLFFLLCVILAHGKENTETLKKIAGRHCPCQRQHVTISGLAAFLTPLHCTPSTHTLRDRERGRLPAAAGSSGLHLEEDVADLPRESAAWRSWRRRMLRKRTSWIHQWATSQCGSAIFRSGPPPEGGGGGRSGSTARIRRRVSLRCGPTAKRLGQRRGKLLTCDINSQRLAGEEGS